MAGATEHLQYFTPGSHTFTVPSNATDVMIYVWGAGGGGGASNSMNEGGGGAGGSCFYTFADDADIQGVELTIVVASGGLGGTENGDGGNDSGVTQLTCTLNTDEDFLMECGDAYGGHGAANGGGGGDGGLAVGERDGLSLINAPYFYYNFGTSGASQAMGNGGSGGEAASYGTETGGAGGLGGAANNAGSVGGDPGAGGGGAGKTMFGADLHGGAGGDGYVIVRYVAP